MSVDLGPAATGIQLSDEEVIGLAREAIEASRDEIRRTRNEGLGSDLQQPGVTVDLGHKNIAHLPDEVIDIIKDEIERLAISHNRVSSFPARLSECKRLRYLNVRYNQLKEIPEPILQLSSLEILDISRNKLRALPEEIRQLSSLKVLAISRNRIEKLPLCLGDMTSLRMLKLDDNPLTFPPPEIWKQEAIVHSPAGGAAEAEAQITTTIKRYLRQVAGAANSRQRLLVESDGEQSEQSMETPRPARALRTRFPVRPSLGGGSDTSGSTLAVSPEGSLSIIDRSHSRAQSSQSVLSVNRPSLLSPPQAVETAYWMAEDIRNEITVRPKRHGIVTPRVTEPPAFPLIPQPITPMEPYTFPGSAFSTPESQNIKQTNGHPNQAFHALLELVETVINVSQQLASRVQNLVTAISWREQSNSLDELSKAAETFDKVISSINNACDQAYEEFELSQDVSAQPNVRSVIRRLAGPIAEAMDLASLLISRVSQQIDDVVLRSKAQARNIIWMLTQLDSEITGAAFLLTQLLQHNTGAHVGGLTTTAIDTTKQRPSNIVDRQAAVPGLGGHHRKQPDSTSSVSAEAWPSEDEQYSQFISASASAMDSLFVRIIQSLVKQTDYGATQINDLYINLRNEHAEVERSKGLSKELTVMENLITHTEKYLQAADAMELQLKAAQTDEIDARNSTEFWVTVRGTMNEFSELGQACAGIQVPALKGLKQEVKMVMKPLHAILKETSNLIKASPWADWLSGPDRIRHRKNLSGGSVPPTPLSAALGPAAQAVQPSGLNIGSGGGATSNGKPGLGKITFTDRFEKYQAAQQQQRSAASHGRRY